MANAFGLSLNFIELQSSVAYTNMSLNASTTKVAWAFQSPVAFTCSRALFRYGARTGTPPTYVVTLEGLNSSGNPDGTDIGGGSPTATTFTPPADTTWNGTTREITLTNSVAITKGQWVAMVVDYSSGTVDGSNFSSFTTGSSTLRFGQKPTIPWPLENTGSWNDRTEYPFYGLGDGTNYYGFPAQTVNQPTTNTANNRDALRFILASGWGSTFKILGLRFYGRQSMTGGSIKVGVWEGTTEKQADTYDSDYNGSVTGDGDSALYYFSSPVALDFGTAYYCGVENVSGTSTLFVDNVQVSTAAHLGAFPGGAEFYRSTYDGASWTDDNTRRPLIDLILDDWTEPSGGSGGIIGGPNLRAGMMA